MAPWKKRVNTGDTASNQLGSKPSLLSIRIPGFRLVSRGGDSDESASRNLEDGSDEEAEDEDEDEDDCESDAVKAVTSKKRKRMPTIETDAAEGIL